MEPRKLVLAIDFNNVVYTSAYGTPLVNSKGEYVNAIKGFFTKLRIMKQQFDPDFIVFASDLSRDTFRRQLYPAYKAQRKPTDPNIKSQMKHISTMVGLLGFQILNHPFYEADDVLGMISRLSERNDMDCIICSSDRDMYQLITDHTAIASPRNDLFVDKEYLMQRYSLTPEQWIELKCLQGDKSDNIPGIRGIGESSALKLMQAFGSINAIYDSLDMLDNHFKGCLTAGKADIPLTKQLVTIVTDPTKISLELKQLYRRPPLANELMDMIADLEIPSLFNIMNYTLLPQYNDNMEVYQA